MKVGIMQPYLFPYIGYFQLINAVDKFVIYDDVQYIKGGWINRNKILVNQKAYMFTFSLKRDSSQLKIYERFFSDNFDKEKLKFFKTLKENYGNLDNYNVILPLLTEALDTNNQGNNISKIITNSIKVICDYLEINTQIINSVELDDNKSLCGEDRVIEINKKLNSSHYINSSGGKKLYSKEKFLSHGIMLNFLESNSIQYTQNNVNYLPCLSIIDTLMFNSKEQVKIFLDEYNLT
ncbi:WbqC family protein [Bacillus sp. AFS040349]|uniref:WbqC family protein n=1 Tax=Bacillus sp. AFS040349 TaxID=2033502 RepID=UPI000BFD8B00|nr:WbqC family protein [Bacillus sp. AFS040349]PGT81122.1 hypothetical protein COD11_18890 [Bacillus sp. AFS040349]